MCPDRESELVMRIAGRAAQRGFSIVTAIFLLVVLAALGAFMATFSSVQNITSAQDLQGASAYQAARAGIEWGSYQALRNTSCLVGPTPLTLGGSLAGIAVTVGCADSGAITEGSATNIHIYVITSTATLGATPGSINYVQRQLQATVGK